MINMIKEEGAKCQHCGTFYPVKDLKQMISLATKNIYQICPQCEPHVKDYYARVETHKEVSKKDKEIFLQRGDQIIYVPDHAKHNVGHKDAESGFVTDPIPGGGIPGGESSYFCRYWIKGNPGVLRTLANSEATPGMNLVKQDTVLQEVVDIMLQGLGYSLGSNTPSEEDNKRPSWDEPRFKTP